MFRDREYDIHKRLSQYETVENDSLFLTPNEHVYLANQGHTLFKLNKRAQNDYTVGASVIEDSIRKKQEEAVRVHKELGASDENPTVQAIKADVSGLTKFALGATTGVFAGTLNKPMDWLIGEKEMDALRTTKGLANPYAIGRMMGQAAAIIPIARGLRYGAGAIGLGVQASKSPLFKNLAAGKFGTIMKGGASLIPAGIIHKTTEQQVDNVYKGKGINLGQAVQTASWFLLTDSLMYAGIGGLGYALRQPAGQAATQRLFAGLSTASKYISSPLIGGGAGATVGGTAGLGYGTLEGFITGKEEVGKHALEKARKWGAAGGGLGLAAGAVVARKPEHTRNLFLAARQGIVKAGEKANNALAKAELMGFTQQDINRLASLVGITKQGKPLDPGVANNLVLNTLDRTIDRTMIAINELRKARGLPPKEPGQFQIKDMMRYLQKRIIKVSNSRREIMEGMENGYVGLKEGLPRWTHGRFKDRLKVEFDKAKNLAPLVKQHVLQDTYKMFNDIVNPQISKFGIRYAPKHVETLNKRVRDSYTRVINNTLKDDLKQAPDTISDLMIAIGQKFEANALFKKIAEQAKKRPFQNEQELLKFMEKGVMMGLKKELKGRNIKEFPVQASIGIAKRVAGDVSHVIKHNAELRRQLFRSANAPLQTISSNLTLKQINQLLRSVGAKIDDSGVSDAYARGTSKHTAGYKWMYKKLVERRDAMISNDFGVVAARELRRLKSWDSEIAHTSLFLKAAQSKGVKLQGEIAGIMSNSLLRYSLGKSVAGPIGATVAYTTGMPVKGALTLGADDFFKMSLSQRIRRYGSGINPTVSFNIGNPKTAPIGYFDKPMSLIKSTGDWLNNRWVTFDQVGAFLSNQKVKGISLGLTRDWPEHKISVSREFDEEFGFD